jgi:hypothetical protein
VKLEPKNSDGSGDTIQFITKTLLDDTWGNVAIEVFILLHAYELLFYYLFNSGVFSQLTQPL